jgi:hypothetical protein
VQGLLVEAAPVASAVMVSPDPAMDGTQGQEGRPTRRGPCREFGDRSGDSPFGASPAGAHQGAESRGRGLVGHRRTAHPARGEDAALRPPLTTSDAAGLQNPFRHVLRLPTTAPPRWVLPRLEAFGRLGHRTADGGEPLPG